MVWELNKFDKYMKVTDSYWSYGSCSPVNFVFYNEFKYNNCNFKKKS